jgi:hypothetical protein
MNIIQRFSAPGLLHRALNPRTLFPLLLAAAALCGCARRYDLMLTNQVAITNVRDLKRSPDGGSYTFVMADGQTMTIPASRVRYTYPHGDKKGTVSAP